MTLQLHSFSFPIQGLIKGLAVNLYSSMVTIYLSFSDLNPSICLPVFRVNEPNTSYSIPL